MKQNKLMAIDGNAILTRAFYGVHEMTSPDGQPTNAVYGFLKIMDRVIREEGPDALCVAFDVSKDTFRRKMYPEYKQTRHPHPPELHMQVEPTKEVLRAMNIPVFELQDWEADDILGTIAVEDERAGWRTIVVTGDKDALQLITCDTTVKMLKTGSSHMQTINYTPEEFFEEYHFSPFNLIDLKALMGDKSDNIPGVRGIGEKTAMALVQKYGDLENIYRALDDLVTPEGKPHRPSVRARLEADKANARLSLNLATIRRHVPIDFAPERALRKDPDRDALKALFLKMGMKSLIEEYKL